jgi:hypothetical protein
MATTHYARTKNSTAVLTAADEYTQAVAAQVEAAEDLEAAEDPDAIGMTPGRLATANEAHSRACDRLAAAELQLKRASLYWAEMDPTLAE